MKKLRFRRLMLAVMTALLMSGCSADVTQTEEAAEEGPAVYYLNEQGTGLLTALSDTSNTGDDAIRDLFNTLKNGEYSDGHSALPQNLELDHTAWQENSVVLYLTGQYPQPGTVEETFCRASIALTVLSAADAESVIININHHPLTDETGREIGEIRRSDFMLSLSDPAETGEEIELTLYFLNGDGTALVKEKVDAELEEGTPAESEVMTLLAAGPKETGHLPALPAGAGILGVSVRERICYVNLNEAFRNPESDVPDELMLYSIVNSLTELDSVDKVQITVNGSADITYDGGLSISSPLSPRPELAEGGKASSGTERN